MGIQTSILNSEHHAILYILANMSGEKIPFDDRKIHETFYELKKDYSTFFKNILFDTNGSNPVSEDLHQILSGFKLSGIIERNNSYDYIFDKKCKKIVLDNLYNNFSIKEKEILSEMSTKFQDLLIKI